MQRYTLETCSQFDGVAVVIDVLRAFTTAAFAFGAGAKTIVLTDTIESAFELRRRFPESLLLGERDGYAIDGFDFSNSPSTIRNQVLTGLTLIQRTTAGTQGVVRSVKASGLFVASFPNARATARALQATAPESIGFVLTGGDEDAACADYIEQLRMGRKPNFPVFAERVRQAKHGQRFMRNDDPAFPLSDLEASLEVDRFNFAMKVERSEGLCLLRACS